MKHKLVYISSGLDVPDNEEVHRVDDHPGNVVGSAFPKHPASSGRVWVKWWGDNHVSEYFPHVFGMKIVEVE